jgi:hypothetical protein
VEACTELSAATALYRVMDMTFWLLQAEARLVPLADSAGYPTMVQMLRADEQEPRQRAPQPRPTRAAARAADVRDG